MTEGDLWNLSQRLTLQLDALTLQMTRIADALDRAVPVKPIRPIPSEPAGLDALVVVGPRDRVRWEDEARRKVQAVNS